MKNSNQQSAISNQQRTGKAFTLVELLVVIAIFGGVMGALLISFLVGKSSYLSADAYIQVQQEARRALDAMVRELREAGWRPGNITPYTQITGGNTLDFQIVLGYNATATIAGCPANAICWGANDANGNGVYDWSVRYLISGTQLIRRTLNDTGGATSVSDRVMANNVSATSFTYSATPKTIDIQLTISQTSGQLPGGSMSISPSPLTTKVRLRN